MRGAAALREHPRTTHPRRSSGASDRNLFIYGPLRQRTKSPQRLHAERRAVWQREHELLDQLTALLDDAHRALCEALPPLPGVDAGRADR
jgi:hypothetical protein